MNEMDNKGIGYQEVEEITIQEEEVDSIPAYLRGEGKATRDPVLLRDSARRGEEIRARRKA